jgi:hypothetical protein
MQFGPKSRLEMVAIVLTQLEEEALVEGQHFFLAAAPLQ